MRDCGCEHVEAFVHGELDDPAEMRAHLRTCTGCRREAAWLRAERRVFAERAQRESWTLPSFDELMTPCQQPALVYEAVAIAEEPSVARERRWWMPAAVVLSAAAALAALLPSPAPLLLEPSFEEPSTMRAAHTEACNEVTPLDSSSCELPAASREASNSSDIAEPACPLTPPACLEAPLCSMPEM